MDKYSPFLFLERNRFSPCSTRRAVRSNASTAQGLRISTSAISPIVELPLAAYSVPCSALAFPLPSRLDCTVWWSWGGGRIVEYRSKALTRPRSSQKLIARDTIFRVGTQPHIFGHAQSSTRLKMLLRASYICVGQDKLQSAQAYAHLGSSGFCFFNHAFPNRVY